MRMYWTFQDDMAVINGIIVKGRHVIIPKILKTQALDANHLGIEKTKLLACKSVYWVNINDDIENHIKIELHALHFSTHSQGQDNTS